MDILLWIVFGGLVGWVASLMMGTDSQQGVIVNVAVGVIGAFIGGWVMSLLGESGVSGFNLYSFAVALVGAVLLIVTVQAVRQS
jgi:uncharacterized membrane protein YeaQ/YmgE (transglycosylase-associated protein family)